MDLSTIENALIVLCLINIAIVGGAAFVFNKNCDLRIELKYLWMAIADLEAENEKRKQEAA